jgi:hypothetical protein
MKKGNLLHSMCMFSRRVGLRRFYTTIEYLALDYNMVYRLMAVCLGITVLCLLLVLVFAAANRFPSGDFDFVSPLKLPDDPSPQRQ